MSCLYFILFLSIGAILAAVPKEGQDKKLSDKEPGSPDYDHEAFLGKEEAHKFDELTLEESKRRLGIIVDKIDKDDNGQVTVEEMKDWINFTQNRHLQKGSDKEFDRYDINHDRKLYWDEYRKVAHGITGSQTMVEREERRFKAADVNGDGHCSTVEFKAFLYAEEHDHMKDIVIEETLEEIDVNKDGFIDLEEYIGEVHYDRKKGKEPEWVEKVRKNFKEKRDFDQNGKLDVDEILDWVVPEREDFEDEAIHLIDEADDNKDGQLSKEEFLLHPDKFVSSKLTHWGEELKGHHDEF